MTQSNGGWNQSTRVFFRLEDFVKELKETSDQQPRKLKELTHMMKAMKHKIDQLAEKLMATRVSMEADSLISTNPRTRYTLEDSSKQLKETEDQ